MVHTKHILNLLSQLMYCNDIANALENRTELDCKKPRKSQPKTEYEDARRYEDKSIDAIFKIEVASFFKRK